MIKLINRSTKTALVGKNIHFTCNELLIRINSYSCLFNEMTGERMIIFAENRPEWIIALYAGWKNGAVVVPVDALSTEDDVAYIINDCKPRAVFCSVEKSGIITDVIRKIGQSPDIFIFENLHLAEAGVAPEEVAVPDPEKTALILYTSGTTGKPKGVMLSFQNILTNLNAVCHDVKIYTPDDSVMILLPLHHILPLVGTIVAPLYVGGTMVMNSSLAAEDMMATLKQFKVSMMIGVPRLYQLIYKGLRERIKQNPLASFMFWIASRVNSHVVSKKLFRTVHKKFGGNIRYLISGGAAIEPEVVSFFQVLGFEFLEGYGMTETAPMITFTRPGTVKPGIPGQLLPGIKIKFVDDEIAVSGPNVMQGYYNKPEETREVLKDGWLYTGDLGFLDEQQYLHITGRKKEIIVLPNGKNINPEEIELALLKHCTMVKETGVFIKDGILQAILLPEFKKLNEAGVKNIEEYFRWSIIDPFNKSLSPYKKILRFHITSSELPKTRLGKIKRYQLPELITTREKTAGIEPQIREYLAIKEFLEGETSQIVHPDDHIELDLALDSLGKVSLSAFIETAFGIEIAESNLSDFQSVSKLAEYIHLKKTRISFEGISWSHILSEKIHVSLPESWFTHNLFKNIIQLILRMFMRIRATGIENLPDVSCIITPNHQSILDGFLVASLFKRQFVKKTYVYAKEKHFRGRLLRFLAHRNNIILVDVNKDLKLSIQKLAEVLKKGKNLLIFPEGTRSLTGKLGEFKQTFAILSHELKVPVIPVAIRGSFDILPSGARFPKLFRKVYIDFMQPVYPENHSYESLKIEVYQNLKNKLNE
jgi:long-chain acyl-CoA synthetase